MLRSIMGENDHTSSGSAKRPKVPKIAAIARLTGSAQYSWWSTAGIASVAPPAMAAKGPTRIPRRIVGSKDRSAARKFGTMVRTKTPRVRGAQMMMTSHAVCRGVRRSNRRRFLKLLDRAKELETAAATPSSISNVIRISLGSGWVTQLLYAGRATSHPMGGSCNLISMKQKTYNQAMPFVSVTKVANADFPTRWGQFRILGFEGVIENPAACNDNIPPPALRVEGAVALVMGDIHSGPPIVRIHSQCLTGDVFHSLRCDCRQQFELAMALITDEGRGIMLYEQQEGRGIGLMAKLRAYELQDKGLDTIEANLELGYEADCRHYELPAEILKQLNVNSVRLITNNPAKVEALELAGVKVVERISAEVPPEPTNERYLQTKREKMGHLVS